MCASGAKKNIFITFTALLFGSVNVKRSNKALLRIRNTMLKVVGNKKWGGTQSWLYMYMGISLGPRQMRFIWLIVIVVFFKNAYFRSLSELICDLRNLKKVCMLIFAMNSGSSLVAIINSKTNLPFLIICSQAGAKYRARSSVYLSLFNFFLLSNNNRANSFLTCCFFAKTWAITHSPLLITSNPRQKYKLGMFWNLKSI